MSRLAGKLAVVTGASSGIGAATAQALAREGAAVVGFARRFSQARVEAPPVAGQVLEVALDVTDEAAVGARFAELPGIDLLVCSAGNGIYAPVVHATVADVRAMLEVHVVGSFLCGREALRRMQVQRRGHIVNISSVAAQRSFSDCAGYTAAKAGQLGLTRVLAEEARPYDVRVTAILPGPTDTPIWDDRPGFDRSKMMRADDVASLVVSIVTRPGISVEEVVIMPPGGAL
jgi:NAD(P)-dependent dehydrogenase (short-subunit alcohol dehydrogenase family)